MVDGHQPKHDPDFAGNRYFRTFSEERTSYAHLTFSAYKNTATLIDDLMEMHSWVRQNAPGGQFRLLRCDFGGEYAQQGHGHNVLVPALRAYCDWNPDFKAIPVAPHSSDRVKAENTIGLLGLAFANACRAHLGFRIFRAFEALEVVEIREAHSKQRSR